MLRKGDPGPGQQRPLGTGVGVCLCVCMYADTHNSRQAKLRAAREQIQHVDLIWDLILNNL